MAGSSGIVIATFVLALLVIIIAAEREYKRNIVRGVNRVGYVVLLLFILIAPFASHAGPTAFRVMCANNSVHQISMALHQYHAANKCYPPAVVRDSDGNAMHSWRVLILPYLYLDNAERFQKYDFSEPWNGPNNRLLADPMPRVYRCEAEREYSHTNELTTNFVAVVGQQTAWPENTALKEGDIHDEKSRTIHVVETTNAGIHWMEPRDLTMDQVLAGLETKTGPGISSFHRVRSGLLHEHEGVNVAFTDSSVKFLPTDLAPETLKGLLTINGAEQISNSDEIPFHDHIIGERLTTLVVVSPLLTLYLAWLWFHMMRSGTTSSFVPASDMPA